MSDLFVGTWKLNRDKSTFDANHRPSEGTMRLEPTASGGYLLSASGKNQRGEAVTERPQTFVPDGKPYPIDGMPGLATITSRPDALTLRAEVRREDGSLAGEGSYAVSPDGASLVATTAGFDSQLRRFEMTTVWDRVA